MDASNNNQVMYVMVYQQHHFTSHHLNVWRDRIDKGKTSFDDGRTHFSWARVCKITLGTLTCSVYVLFSVCTVKVPQEKANVIVPQQQSSIA